MKGRCPRCGERFTAEPGPDAEHFPFCSRRCRMADLDRWFTEDYSIPGGPEGVGDPEESSP
jgi:endogenous inhibitor of DNA gyrase (YacG/DUF329 family)